MSRKAWKRVCFIPGCFAPAAALGACTTHLGLNGGPRLVAVPKPENTTGGAPPRPLTPKEVLFAAKLKAEPGKSFWVPFEVMPYQKVGATASAEAKRIVKRINHSGPWSRLPGQYRAWSRGGVVFATWLPDEEAEVVASAVSKRYA